jgi:excisionase family DNA binding protein
MNLKLSEAAERLNVSVKTLQRWDRDGVLKALRTPTDRRYYTDEQIDSLLEKNVGLVIPEGEFSYAELVLRALNLGHGEHIDVCMKHGESGIPITFCLSCAFIVGTNVLLLGMYGFANTIQVFSQSEDDDNLISVNQVEAYFNDYLEENSKIEWKVK